MMADVVITTIERYKGGRPLPIASTGEETHVGTDRPKAELR